MSVFVLGVICPLLMNDTETHGDRGQDVLASKGRRLIGTLSCRTELQSQSRAGRPVMVFMASIRNAGGRPVRVFYPNERLPRFFPSLRLLCQADGREVLRSDLATPNVGSYSKAADGDWKTLRPGEYAVCEVRRDLEEFREICRVAHARGTMHVTVRGVLTDRIFAHPPQGEDAPVGFRDAVGKVTEVSEELHPELRHWKEAYSDMPVGTTNRISFRVNPDGELVHIMQPRIYLARPTTAENDE